MGESWTPMPLTEFQTEVLCKLRTNRTPSSYLAGGAALHIEPRSIRYSNDLDFFHDAGEKVQEGFQADSDLLDKSGYKIEVVLQTESFIRAVVSRNDSSSTKIEWARDSAWRFLPVLEDEKAGYILHPIDLALNKLLALAGRDEARDFLDIIVLSMSC